MKLEADRLQNLDLSDSHVGPERDVVLEERRMRVDNEPQSLMGEQMRPRCICRIPMAAR